MKPQATCLPPEKFMYRDFKNFNAKSFIEDVKLKKFCRKSDDSDGNYEFL